MEQIADGCRVRLAFPDEEVEYVVRNPRVKKVSLGEISTDSPLGRELLGCKVGDSLSLTLGMGQTIECRVVGISFHPVV